MKSVSICWWLLSCFSQRSNRDFTNTCECFVDIRLSIDFGEDKITSILFASKCKIKKVPKLNITDNNIQIKQNSKLIDFICILNKTMLGKSKTLKVINRINSRLKFLHMKKLRYAIYDVMLLFNLTLNSVLTATIQNGTYFENRVWNSWLVAC